MKNTSLKPKSINLKQQNKSPLSGYYGGKYRMSNLICSMIPPHETYVEPFFGGGSIFFLKKRSKHEVINDLDNDVYKFWKVCKESGNELYKRFNKFKALKEYHDRAKRVLKGLENPKDEIDFAYCVFLSIGLSFRNIKSDIFATSKDVQKSIKKKIENLNCMPLRLKNVLVYNYEAIYVISEYKDNEDALFYLDPPYPENSQGHYKGYTMKDFNNLCQALKRIKGKFILSCYLKDGMNLDPKWKIKEKSIFCSVDTRSKKTKRTEALIYNF